MPGRDLHQSIPQSLLLLQGQHRQRPGFHVEQSLRSPRIVVAIGMPPVGDELRALATAVDPYGRPCWLALRRRWPRQHQLAGARARHVLSERHQRAPRAAHAHLHVPQADAQEIEHFLEQHGVVDVEVEAPDGLAPDAAHNPHAVVVERPDVALRDVETLLGPVLDESGFLARLDGRYPVAGEVEGKPDAIEIVHSHPLASVGRWRRMWSR